MVVIQWPTARLTASTALIIVGSRPVTFATATGAPATVPRQRLWHRFEVVI